MSYHMPERPRSGGCAGAGGPRGATPHSRSGGAAVRKYSFHFSQCLGTAFSSLLAEGIGYPTNKSAE